MSEWRDISSAPRDGTPIDLFVAKKDGPIGRAIECRYRHFGRYGGWEMKQGKNWFQVAVEPPSVLEGDTFATHWMPLPEPPK